MSTAAMTREIRPEYAPLGPLEVRTSFRGQLIHTRLIDIEPGTTRSQVRFRIGATADSDAPAPTEILGDADLPLVTTFGQDFLVNVAPGMGGQIQSGGKVIYLADYLANRGSSFALPVDASARIDCGPMSFTLARSAPVEAVPRPRLDPSPRKHPYLYGSLVAVGLFLGLIFMVPSEAASLSFEHTGVPANIKEFLSIPKTTPPVEEEKASTGQGGDSGKAHVGDPGQMGKQDSKARNKAYAVAGNSPNRVLGKAEAAAAIRETGILGVIKSVQGSAIGSIWSDDETRGNDAQTLLGNLTGVGFGDAYGVRGLGPSGSGAGGGGTGLTTIGTGEFNTMGRNVGYNPAGGSLGTRRPVRIDANGGGQVTVKGSLNKEIIRRVVRLHMNEFRFCYDKELPKNPGLSGRISAQFLIAQNGQVLSSFIASTTMNNVHVESCVSSAIKRLEFPKPDGGGVVMVSYPFNFVSAQ